MGTQKNNPIHDTSETPEPSDLVLGNAQGENNRFVGPPLEPIADEEPRPRRRRRSPERRPGQPRAIRRPVSDSESESESESEAALVLGEVNPNPNK